MPDSNKKPKGAIQAIKEQVKPLEFSDWRPNPKDVREDGSIKGMGFLGPLKRPDGGISSELGFGTEINGKEMEIPAMVPTLERHEINYLLNTPADKQHEADPQIWKSIAQKAFQHAVMRLKSGKSVWAEEGESPTRPPVFQ
jgi:hypothetical protein